MEIIRSNKGREKICFEGHMYTKQIERATHIRWRCVKRTQFCKGILTTNPGMQNPVLVNDHNHASNEATVSMTKCVEKMKRKAASSQDKPAQIFTSHLTELTADARACLPNQDSIKRTIRNQRSKMYPVVPESIRDLVIEGQWTLTAGTEPKNFLFFDNGPDTDSRVIAFGSDESLKLLAAADTWMMDGNFAMAPPGFSQIYVIRVPLGETAVSTVFAILQGKSQETYEIFLQAVIDYCNTINVQPDPTTVIVDFEKAVIRAINSVLGDETSIQGCFYHLTQSTWRKIQNLGLVNIYKASDDFRQFCGELDALAFLPVEDVHAGMEHLKDICPGEAAPLLEYFDQTYVSGNYVQRRRNPQEGVPALNVRRIPPRFPPVLWNVHGATLNDCPRTNNMCEGWNNKFFHLVGHHHPSIWKLISSFQKEEAEVSTIIAKDSIGQPPKKRTKRVYRDLQQRLKNLCRDYSDGRKNLSDTLRGLGHNIRF